MVWKVGYASLTGQFNMQTLSFGNSLQYASDFAW